MRLGGRNERVTCTKSDDLHRKPAFPGLDKTTDRALGSCLPPSQGRTELLLSPGRSSDRRPRAREKGPPRGARRLLSEQLARRGVPAGRRKHAPYVDGAAGPWIDATQAQQVMGD